MGIQNTCEQRARVSWNSNPKTACLGIMAMMYYGRQGSKRKARGAVCTGRAKSGQDSGLHFCLSQKALRTSNNFLFFPKSTLLGVYQSAA